MKFLGKKTALVKYNDNKLINNEDIINENENLNNSIDNKIPNITNDFYINKKLNDFINVQNVLLSEENLRSMITVRPELYQNFVILSTIDKNTLKENLINYIITITNFYNNLNRTNFVEIKKTEEKENIIIKVSNNNKKVDKKNEIINNNKVNYDESDDIPDPFDYLKDKNIDKEKILNINNYIAKDNISLDVIKYINAYYMINVDINPNNIFNVDNETIIREINLVNEKTDFNNNIPKFILFNAGFHIKYYQIIRDEIYNCLKLDKNFKNILRYNNLEKNIEDISKDNNFIDHQLLLPFALKYNIGFVILLDNIKRELDTINEESNQKIYLVLRLEKEKQTDNKIYHTFVNVKMKKDDFAELHNRINCLIIENHINK